jgi:hypothetical protein
VFSIGLFFAGLSVCWFGCVCVDFLRRLLVCLPVCLFGIQFPCLFLDGMFGELVSVPVFYAGALVCLFVRLFACLLLFSWLVGRLVVPLLVCVIVSLFVPLFDCVCVCVCACMLALVLCLCELVS